MIDSSNSRFDFSPSPRFPLSLLQTESCKHLIMPWIIYCARSILPSGLECLQQDTPCFLGQPECELLSPYPYQYLLWATPSSISLIWFCYIVDSSFAVDCGGSRSVKSDDKFIYESDGANLQGASYYVTRPVRWGVSNTGKFYMGEPNRSYIIYTSNQFNKTLDSELFQTARTSPSSLRYYGIGLKNGKYIVALKFAEIFPDGQIWQSMGRRIFDIYIQVTNSSLW